MPRAARENITQKTLESVKMSMVEGNGREVEDRLVFEDATTVGTGPAQATKHERRAETVWVAMKKAR